MSPQSPHHPGDSIAEALDRRERDGRPVRIGLIGAGQMGTDIIVQTELMRGIEVVAAADAVPENVFTARAVAGNGARAPELADDPAAAARAIARGRLAVCKSYRSVCMADGVDVIIDATGNPNVGAQVALCAIAAGKHMVMMNVEADVTIGPYLSAKAEEAGVVYTLGAGDEPSSTMELINFLRGLGYPIIAAGKGKNNAFRVDATPDAYAEEAKRRNMNPRMLVEFVDGSKTMVEMVALANATGLVPDIPGMHGPSAALASLHKTFCPREEGGLLSRKGVVDFSVARGVAPGVFAVAEMRHPRLRERMNDLQLGEGPYYTFYRPYRARQARPCPRRDARFDRRILLSRFRAVAHRRERVQRAAARARARREGHAENRQGRLPYLRQLRARRTPADRPGASRAGRSGARRGCGLNSRRADRRMDAQSMSVPPLPDARTAERPELATLDRETLRTALHRMHLIRKFEEVAEASYARGLIHGTMHLSIGQEASAVGSILALRADDYILSTHRGHGHCIAKGGDPARMLAEFFGKENGYCHGRGGSMHIADVEGGNLGANGIVAGGLPIAVGVGMSIKAQKQDRVCMVFFGDGAANEGAFHEALNMASIWKLPVVFVCENNKYGMSMDIAKAMAVPNVADRASAYAMPGVALDGNDLPAVTAATQVAVTRARSGGGPSLIECKTYRLRGHSKSDRNLYRTREEIEAWRKRDPILRLQGELIAQGRFEAAELADIEKAAQAQIEAALEFAKASPDPDPAELTRDVYAH